jgi:hypothetical protein
MPWRSGQAYYCTQNYRETYVQASALHKRKAPDMGGQGGLMMRLPVVPVHQGSDYPVFRVRGRPRLRLSLCARKPF